MDVGFRPDDRIDGHLPLHRRGLHDTGEGEPNGAHRLRGDQDQATRQARG